MEGKVTIRGVEWDFHQRGDLWCCATFDPVTITPKWGGTSKMGRSGDGRAGYLGGVDTLGEAIEVAVGISARTNPFPDEVFDA